MTIDSPQAGATDRRIAGTERRVLVGTFVGTTIEWYDFIVYAQAAGLVLAQLYFAPVGGNTVLAQLIAWASVGISFFFRPLGAIFAGHLGDRYGRKAALVATLLLMGAATTAIGLLPTAAQIGWWAPALLMFFRIVQGFSAGGEWGGAALMAVEHAPKDRRGLFGASPQLGVPAGLLLATLVLMAVSASTTEEQFLAWGWRIPFLLSVLLLVVGYLIRRSIAESPVFTEIAERKQRSTAPLRSLIRTNLRDVFIVAFAFMGTQAAGYMLISFFAAYATTTLGMDRTPVLLVSLLAALSYLLFTLTGGYLSDRAGRLRVTRLGYVLIIVWAIPAFALIATGHIMNFAVGVLVFTIGCGLSYGPMSALFAERFPAHIRYSGISIGYAVGSILGGAFAPLIAESLLGATGSAVVVGGYITAICGASAVTVWLLSERQGVDLTASSEPVGGTT
jgi:MFS family permease